MSKWTYYSPTLGGAILGILITVQSTPGWAWPARLGVALGAVWIGMMLAMLLMVGCQGMLVSVMPAGRGKSIRGRGATVAGGLTLLAFALGVPGVMIASEGAGPVAWTLGGICAGLAVLALAIYLWSLPAAKVDFRDPDLRHRSVPGEAG